MVTVDELREIAHKVYAQARASLDPSTKQELLRVADDYLKQADALRCGHVVQAVFPKSDGKIGG